MTAEDFLAWQDERADHQRFELLDGTVISMAADCALHARIKAAVFRQFERLIADAGLPCEAFPDGMAVRVDKGNVFEPDALVRCGERLPDDAVVIDDPIIVVEVALPSTQRADALIKFARYFRNPHILHCLIGMPEARIVIHHRRQPDGRIETTSFEGGEIAFEQPPLTLQVDALFAPAA